MTPYEAIYSGNAQAQQRIFDVRVPDALVDFVRAVSDAFGDDAESVIDDAICLRFGGRELRYPRTPPELFPIASMGVDGVHWGLIIHDERQYSGDACIGHFAPMDDHVWIQATNASGWLAATLCDALHSCICEESDLERASVIESIAQSAEMDIVADDVFPDVGAIEQSYPNGWSAQTTVDGLDVAAPSSSFHDRSPNVSKSTSWRELRAVVESMNEQGNTGSALALLRDLLQVEVEVQPEMLVCLASTYGLLGRPLHARVAQWMMSESERLDEITIRRIREAYGEDMPPAIREIWDRLNKP